jgi:dihydrodipicolinate synthase/N-acetylneuraminate lyase
VAAAVDIPIIVQDYPPISGYAMEASVDRTTNEALDRVMKWTLA